MTYPVSGYVKDLLRRIVRGEQIEDSPFAHPGDGRTYIRWDGITIVGTGDGIEIRFLWQGKPVMVLAQPGVNFERGDKFELSALSGWCPFEIT